MRRIVFRAKRKDNGMWAYGCYLYDGKNHIHYIVEMLTLTKYEVDPSTIGQETDLDDSFRYLEHIYEGDIVSCYGRPAVVELRNGTWQAVQYGDGMTYPLSSIDRKILGNKWDNPELLKRRMI